MLEPQVGDIWKYEGRYGELHLFIYKIEPEPMLNIVFAYSIFLERNLEDISSILFIKNNCRRLA